MCNACWKGYKLWCRAFTKTERCLTLLEAFLLVILIALIVFLILHFLVCAKIDRDVICGNRSYNTTNLYTKYASTTESYTTINFTNSTTANTNSTLEVTDNNWKLTPAECTWIPSLKTPAVSKYYMSTTARVAFRKGGPNYYYSSTSDGEEVNDDLKKSILALVKLRPPSDAVFGCVLTAVHRLWTLTAASCLELVEEMDSLHSYVIMERYGHVRVGMLHNVTDVTVHPLYRGGNRSYDLAAIKSADTLFRKSYLRVATPVDYNTICMGEMFTVVGFGKFRSSSETSERMATGAAVWMMDQSFCESEYVMPRERTQGRYPSICAAVLYARGLPCNYCAGSPIIINRVLYGIMSYNEKCGVSCEPTLYVNMAATHIQIWIQELTGLKNMLHFKHTFVNDD